MTHNIAPIRVINTLEVFKKSHNNTTNGHPEARASNRQIKVRGAIKLLWSRMAKSGQVLPETKPADNVEWDEASCSQVMYLYSKLWRNLIRI